MTKLALDHYRLLGRSGLRVSPLSLGTMTFGSDWGWGSDRDGSRRIFDAYAERGGNFIDSANFYTEGSAERLVGEFTRERRDRFVIATKYTLVTRKGDPNSGGNHRKSMIRSLEDSLKRLNTDYVDLLYLHAWDGTTSSEEVLGAFDDLVRAGKILYAGMSNTPAWQISHMQALADVRGLSPLAALQIEYSLAQRGAERELLPMARALGLGVLPWSPLASGVLTGKYTKADLDLDPRSAAPSGTRKGVAAGNGALTEKNLEIAEVVKQVARELDASPAAVALRWTLDQPGVTSPIIGARTLEQLEQNLRALELEIPSEQAQRLAAASVIELGYPHDFLALPMTRGVISGGLRIEPRA